MVDRARTDEKIEFVLNKAVDDVLGDTKVTGVQLRDTVTDEVSELETDGFFVAIGHDPNTALFLDQLDHEPGSGYLITRGKSTETNIPGVFAAGDVQDHVYRQAVTAAGSGCAAALDAERFLSEQRHAALAGRAGSSPRPVRTPGRQAQPTRRHHRARPTRWGSARSPPPAAGPRCSLASVTGTAAGFTASVEDSRPHAVAWALAPVAVALGSSRSAPCARAPLREHRRGRVARAGSRIPRHGAVEGRPRRSRAGGKPAAAEARVDRGRRRTRDPGALGDRSRAGVPACWSCSERCCSVGWKEWSRASRWPPTPA